MPSSTEPTAAVDTQTMRALTTKPTVWLTVIRQGTTAGEVERYVYEWPTYPLGSDGIFLVIVPKSQGQYIADRLGSGLFYAHVHDSYEAAEKDAVQQSFTLIR